MSDMSLSRTKNTCIIKIIYCISFKLNADESSSVLHDVYDAEARFQAAHPTGLDEGTGTSAKRS